MSMMSLSTTRVRPCKIWLCKLKYIYVYMHVKGRTVPSCNYYLQPICTCNIPCMFWCVTTWITNGHYHDVVMSGSVSQITGVSIVCSIVGSGADHRNKAHASLAFVCGIHRWLVNYPHKWPVTRKMFPFDDVIMLLRWLSVSWGREDNHEIALVQNNLGKLNTYVLIWHTYHIPRPFN